MIAENTQTQTEPLPIQIRNKQESEATSETVKEGPNLNDVCNLFMILFSLTVVGTVAPTQLVSALICRDQPKEPSAVPS